jgi:hypothetical protein
VSAPEKTSKKTRGASDYRLPAGSGWAGAWKIAAGIGVVGLGAAGAGWSMDAKRFAYSYLFAFFLVLTLSLGSMFFILVERLTKAGWSVSVRRTAEFFASASPIFIILFIPVVLSMSTLYPWLSHDEGIEPAAHAQMAPPPGPGGGMQHPVTLAPPGGPGAPRGPMGHPNLERGQRPGGPQRIQLPGTPGAHRGEPLEDPEELVETETLNKKRSWLNRNGWLARAAIYFIAWAWIGLTFFRLSTSQDGTKDPKLTLKAESLAPISTILFAFTLTGAAFDWLMSLLPTWYSTIFGVTIFAGSVVVMYATMILVTMSLRSSGHLKDAVSVEHFHDMGKLLFGFLIFWGYVSFAQFMLIWYAAIPEETTFFHHRWDVGPWMYVSLGIVLSGFVVPFFMLISRNVKRRLWALAIGATWLILMHVVEMYWQVLPYFGKGDVTISWIDLACLFGVAGAYLSVVFYRMTKYPLIPIGDPRLSRSLTFENA